ncbi:MAG TPA: GAF domain-containing SpoIIE family protein phosphatase [Vicinamibacteria bacterium]
MGIVGTLKGLRLIVGRAEGALEGARSRKRRSADRLKLLLDVSRLLSVTSLEALLGRLAEAATALLEAEQVRIFLHDPETNEFWTPGVVGSPALRVPAGASELGEAFRTGEVRNLRDGSPRADVRNMLIAPLRDLDQKTIGAVEVANKKRGSFTDEDVALAELLTDQAAVAIQRYRLEQAAIQVAELRREMELASKVQAALVPRAAPRVEGLEAVGWTRAASITGGDCFDLWRLSDGRLAVFLADASGHGLAAALIIAQVRTLVRALSEIQPDPEWLLPRVNARLAQDLDEGRFVTAFFGCVGSDGSLQWSSAGQGPVFVRRGSEGRFEALSAPGVPLGVSADLIADPSPHVHLEPGGMLAVLSDGFFEARNDGGELFGTASVMTLLDAGGGPSELAGRLAEAIRVWQGRDEPADDQTIVVVQRAR